MHPGVFSLGSTDLRLNMVRGFNNKVLPPPLTNIRVWTSVSDKLH